MKPKVLLVANPRPTHVGRHFMNGADAAGVEVQMMDVEAAYAGPRLLRTLFWRLLGHRPLHLGQFSAAVVERCRQWKPDLVLSTGLAPLSAEALLAIKGMQIPTANFLTDDPWNAQHHAPWFLKSLPHYNVTFTPRRANMPELSALKSTTVQYLPFAYAPEIHHPPPLMSAEEQVRWRSEVLFIGGADADRAGVMRPLRESGFKLDLWGGYWDQMPGLSDCAHGHTNEDGFRRLVANAAVNLCLVRRANRDGHSMRTYELPAVGGCMAVEDTGEHRAIFGEDGETVRYFSDARALPEVLRSLLERPDEQQRLATAVHQRIVAGGTETYAFRLKTIAVKTLSGFV